MNAWKNEEEISACLTACGCTQENIQQYLVVVKHGTDVYKRQADHRADYGRKCNAGGFRTGGGARRAALPA